MKINIQNCNNIDSASIEICEGTLNIKYAANGTGKSTISAAIVATVQKNGAGLLSLTPFKNIDRVGSGEPEVKGLDSVKSVMVFDEHYVSDFVFKPDEAVKGSFEIFVKTPDYDRQMDEISKLLNKISRVFQSDQTLDELINACQRFIEGFGKAAKGYSKTGALLKGLGNGNKVENIPDGLEPYAEFLYSDQNVKWLKWQTDGRVYQKIKDDCCPYCTNGILQVKERIDKFAKEFDAKSVEKLFETVEIFQSLSEYLTPDTSRQLDDIARAADSVENSIDFLLEIKNQASALQAKLLSLRTIGFVSLKDVKEVGLEFESRRLDINEFSHFRSGIVEERFKEINDSISEVLETIGQLKGAIIRQDRLIKDTIKVNKDRIDGFMQSAGYRYEVSIIEDEEGTYKAVISHLDCRDQTITDVSQHFSYGERNAFALAMFMFDAVHKNPDLIILDDPISSFDGNKKFALFNMMFLAKPATACLKNRTVLMLTHDFAPVIDALKVFYGDLAPKPRVHFLKNEGCRIKELEVLPADVLSVRKVMLDNIGEQNRPCILKAVYFRRLLEVDNEKDGLAYQLISNLLHVRDQPTYKQFGENARPMTDEEILNASNEIAKVLPGFHYSEWLEIAKQKDELRCDYWASNSGCEKLHLFRVMFPNQKLDDSVAQKFVNESFHIENDYLYQLNPMKYDTIPQYVIEYLDAQVGCS